MVHFPADYSHELYGSLHKNIIDVILFGLLTNNLLFKDCYHCCPEKFYHKVSCLFEPSSGT